MTVSDRAGRRSNARKITVVAPPRSAAGRWSAPGTLPGRLQGQRHVDLGAGRSEGGDVAAIAARARAAGISTVFVKSSDGASSRWAQFNPGLVAGAARQRAARLRLAVRLRQRPAGRGRLGADAIADGADCLVIDAESQYEGKYAAAQQYIAALRAAVGPDLPDRADLVPVRRLPPAPARTRSSSARAARRPTSRRSTGRTSAGPSTPSPASTLAAQPHLRRRRSPRSARPTATRRRRTSRASARCGRPTAAPACRGGPGRRPAEADWARARPAARARRRCRPPDPGWPALDQGQQGRPGRLAAAAPRVLRPGGDGRRARSTPRPTRRCATSRPPGPAGHRRRRTR